MREILQDKCGTARIKRTVRMVAAVAARVDFVSAESVDDASRIGTRPILRAAPLYTLKCHSSRRPMRFFQLGSLNRISG